MEEGKKPLTDNTHYNHGLWASEGIIQITFCPL